MSIICDIIIFLNRFILLNIFNIFLILFINLFLFFLILGYHILYMIYDVAIIGAGPAGLSAGIFACNAGLNVICFEKLVVGGQASLTYEIVNYTGFEKITGVDLADKMLKHAESAGVKIEYKKVEKIKKLKNDFSIKTKQGLFKAKKIIIASGNKVRKLGLENENKFIGKGVSYCASCDGAFYKNKVVAVVGGGNSAFEYVKYLSHITKKVYVLNRTEVFRCGEHKLNKMQQMKNVEILTNASVKQINGHEVVESVDVLMNKKKSNIQVDGLFVAIGHEPDLDFVDFEIDLDKHGFIKVNDEQKTSVENVFACGDIVSKKFRQIITACADGARAGNACIGE